MDATQTITLPFGTPAEIERAAQFIAALIGSGVGFEADKDGCNWLRISVRS